MCVFVFMSFLWFVVKFFDRPFASHFPFWSPDSTHGWKNVMVVDAARRRRRDDPRNAVPISNSALSQSRHNYAWREASLDRTIRAFRGGSLLLVRRTLSRRRYRLVYLANPAELSIAITQRLRASAVRINLHTRCLRGARPISRPRKTTGALAACGRASPAALKANANAVHRSLCPS